MKNFLLTILTVLVFATACGPSLNTNRNKSYAPSKQIEFKSSDWAVAENDLGFGLNLFKKSVKKSGYSEDVMISPISVSLAFTMVSAGANGGTRQEIINALGFNGLDYSDISSYYKKLSSELICLDEDVTLSLANAFWPDESLSVKESFIREAKNTFNAEVSALDYSKPEDAANTINEWTSNKTGGNINELFRASEIAGAAAVLANAVHFKSEWYNHQVYNTKDLTFNSIDNSKKTCQFFYGKGFINGYFGKDVSVIKLPFGKGSFSFIVVLPAEGADFKKFVSSITSKKWNDWTTAGNDEAIKFSIPCFENQFSFYDYMSALKEMGIKKAFLPGADFSNMANDGLYVSEVIHKTTIKVNSAGAEASAATGVGFIYTGSWQDTINYREFIADRPFVYAIEEASTGTLLFIGTHVK